MKKLGLGLRCCHRIVFGALALLPCTGTALATQVEKTVGTYFKQVQATRNGTDGDYGYQIYNRNGAVDASGLDKDNLILEMELYIENLDNLGNLEIIENATFNAIEVGNELTNGKTWLSWSIKGLTDSEGNAIKAGVWNKIRLPFSTGKAQSDFTLDRPLNYFRWCLAHIHEPAVPDDYLIRFKNIKIVDSSQLVEEEGESEYPNTDYEAATIDFSLDKDLTGSNYNGFSIGKKFDSPLNLKDHNPRMLYLQFDAEITESTSGDINVLKSAPGQIELTSGGKPDVNELTFNINQPDWKTGKHTYSLAFSTAGTTGGSIDYSAVDYMRVYCVHIPKNIDKLNVKIDNVKIIDRTHTTSLPTFFSDGMMFQQKKPINIWGYGASGRTIKVKFYKGDNLLQTKDGVTDTEGRWAVQFDACNAGFDKYKFEVLEGDDVIQTVSDILIGEVWVAAGQSNMALSVSATQQKDELMNSADNDNIRFLYMPTYPYSGTGTGEMPIKPTKDIAGAYWGHGNNGVQVGSVSAVAYIAIKDLQGKLGIPVGFLYTPIGGSVIEAWIPRAELEENTELVNTLTRRGLYYDEDFWVDNSTTVTALYNQKVGPLEGFNVAGVMWYQGESNSDRPELYADELTTMKRGWERTFNFEEGTMPFVFCQVGRWVVQTDKPHYLAALDEAMYDAWAHSESSRSTMSLLPIYDTDMTYVGNVVIHPTNKIPVGTRFATAINNLVYNKNAEYTAPVFESLAKGDDNRLIVKFSHVGEGLKCIDCHDNIHGFTICDERNVYVNAQARIISANEVEVWNDGITSPTDVTYAYATYNFTSNLANSVGIPAVPFRSNRNSEALYYSPQDWTMADADTFWGINGDQAAWLQTWTSTDATLTFDQNNKQEGYSSVNVSYTNDNAKFGPITEYASVVNQLENFNYLNVWVYNPDAREKDIRLEVISENDKVFDCGNVKISAKQEWKQISFDLYANVDQNTRFNKELANAKKLYFVISDANRTGNIKVDNITFGLDKLADKDLSAIVNISTGTNVAADNWLYDLWGHKHEYPTAPGIYVRNGKKIVVKDGFMMK